VLLSMTGFGEARYQSDPLSLSIEVRALNNRYLKVSVRAPEPYQLLEAEFEKVIRRSVKRGTLQIQLRCERQTAPQDFRINPIALSSYVEQIRGLAGQLNLLDQGQSLLGQVLTLPGVVPEPGSLAFRLHDDWPLLEKVLEEALGQLNRMRQDEGRAMAQELLTHRATILHHLQSIRERTPHVVVAFRDRLLDRVRTLLQEVDVQIDKADLIREVSIFSERSDIAEEVVRLATHLDHFQEVVQRESDSPGRKLEFLTQEMAREANTIGSKASDVVISREAVEIKATLEKIRELVQNVE
jgi:uncharacterized protein (TIGR00255 family)